VNLNLPLPRKQLGFLSLVVGGIAAVGSLVSGSKTRTAQNRARAAQQQSNRIKNFQAKRQFLRNVALAQAEAIANPIARGADISSSFAQATLSSQGAQARTASRDFAEQDRLGELASSQLNRAARATMQGNIFSTVGSFATSDVGGSFLDDLGKKIGVG